MEENAKDVATQKVINAFIWCCKNYVGFEESLEKFKKTENRSERFEVFKSICEKQPGHGAYGTGIGEVAIIMAYSTIEPVQKKI